MRMLAAVALAAMLATQTGCVFSYGQLDVLQYGDSFDESYVKFNRSLRWGAWQKAIPYVVPDQRERFMEVMGQLGDITFTDWDVLVLDMSPGLSDAHVEVRIEGYRPATLMHRQAVLVQDWQRIDKKGNWQVELKLEPLSDGFAAR